MLCNQGNLSDYTCLELLTKKSLKITARRSIEIPGDVPPGGQQEWCCEKMPKEASTSGSEGQVTKRAFESQHQEMSASYSQSTELGLPSV